MNVTIESESVEDFVRRTTAESGVPELLEDAGVAAQIAAVLVSAEPIGA